MSKVKESAGSALKEATEELFRTFPDYQDCLDKQLQFALTSPDQGLLDPSEFSDFVHLNRLVKKVISLITKGGAA